MKKSNISLIILASAMFLSIGTMQAQEENTYNERVVVSGKFKPVVEDRNKVNVAPSITDTVATMPHTFTYDVSSVRRLTSLYEPSRIKAARIIGEPATKLYNNYFKLGMGNYWSPLAEIYFNSLRSKNLNYGVRATHQSSWGNIGHADSIPSADFYGMAPFSKTDLGIFGKYITHKNLQLFGDINYQNDYNRYYGFSDSTLYNTALYNRPINMIRDSLKASDYSAVYNIASINVGAKTLNTDVNALGYEANLKAADLWASYGQNELNVNFDGNIHYGFAINNQYKGIAYLHLSYNGYNNWLNPSTLPLGADSLSSALLNTDTAGVNGYTSSIYHGIYRANPYVDFLLKGFQIHGGLTIALDSYNPNTKPFLIHIYPDVLVTKSFMKNFFDITLGAQGNVDANSLNVIRQINPYIMPGAELRATSHYEFLGKVRFNLSKKMELNIYGQYGIHQDDLSFRLADNYQLNNVFKPTYDSLTRIKVGGTFAFVNDEMLRIEALGNYYFYRSLQTVPDGIEQDPLYYRPNWDAGVSATVNYNNKWIGRVEAQLLGKSIYDHEVLPDGTIEPSYLPLRYGVSLQVEYRHNKALSLFIKADNLAFQRYFYWQNYPSQRLLVIGGLTYTIPN